MNVEGAPTERSADQTDSGIQNTGEEKRPSRSKRSFFADPVPWVLLAITLSLDQLTKTLVINGLERGESWPAQGFFRITHAWNTGTAFSLFQGQGGLLTVVSFFAVAGLYFVYRSVEAPSLMVRASFGLLLGGAIGNLTDRLRLGHVTDFVDIGPWPIFNVADSSILVGIAVMFFFLWNAQGDKKSAPDDAPDAGVEMSSSTEEAPPSGDGP